MQAQPGRHLHRRLFLALAGGSFAFAAFCRPCDVQAQPAPASATAFVKSAGDRLVAVINSPGSIHEKQPRLAQIIETAVDVDGVAKFCLGRFWRNATPEQQKQYTTLFHSVLVNNITSKLGEYQGVVFTVNQAQAREETAIVATIVERPGNPPSKVEWVVSDESGAPKVVDVIAEGTSLRLTQRSDYAAYLSRNGNNIQALIDAMRQQIATNG
jgi:phospholipid transport system substrate-binding protein